MCGAGTSKVCSCTCWIWGGAWSWVSRMGKVAQKRRTDRRHWDPKGRWERTGLLLREGGAEEERGGGGSQRDHVCMVCF